MWWAAEEEEEDEEEEEEEEEEEDEEEEEEEEAHLSSGVSTWKVLSMTVVHCRQRMMKVFGLGRSVFISWHSGSHTEIEVLTQILVFSAWIVWWRSLFAAHLLQRSCWAGRPGQSPAVCPCSRWKSRLSSAESSAVASSWCTHLQGGENTDQVTSCRLYFMHQNNFHFTVEERVSVLLVDWLLLWNKMTVRHRVHVNCFLFVIVALYM